MLPRSSTPGPAALYQTAVTVRIPEVSLLRNQSNLSRTLCTYSLDNGPIQETVEGYLLFRFTEFDWHNTLESLLITRHILYTREHRTATNPFERIGKKSIYLAEPKQMAVVLSDALQRAGYNVQTTGSWQDLIKGHFGPIDLFILNRRLNEADGLAICRHLRLHPDTKDTPVIIISEHSQSIEEAFLAGASDLITVPMTLDHFLIVVARHTTTDIYSPCRMIIAR